MAHLLDHSNNYKSNINWAEEVLFSMSLEEGDQQKSGILILQFIIDMNLHF